MKAGGKGLWGWMSFDWANQPFHTVILTFVFGPYFASQVAEDVVSGQAIWGYAIAAGSVLMALSAPVAEAVADARGRASPGSWLSRWSMSSARQGSGTPSPAWPTRCRSWFCWR